ncbi:CGNR zinc finger domain-containing protein [Aeromicrobium sp. CF3.5]|uniref:CGNR zinc finger domain-containing protein n=1 Tax=Aeromicrobium sp. CF3.5 TaxID=3373078 RepID=UPI003EE7E930
MPKTLPDFRPGGVLATSFTGTLSERHGTPVERLPTRQRLVDWLGEHGLAVRSCSAAQLDLARELREAIHLVATAAATGDGQPPSAVRVVNDCSARGTAAALLAADGERQWRLGTQSCVDDALGVVAADAISLVAGERDGRLALCASPTCRAVFLDTSQSRTRRWCDMNTCGNRQKKARLRARNADVATPR